MNIHYWDDFLNYLSRIGACYLFCGMTVYRQNYWEHGR